MSKGRLQQYLANEADSGRNVSAEQQELADVLEPLDNIAAQEGINTWEKGELAGAVTELDL